jgi:poly-D-alanine transfer protein DltD
VAVFGSSELQYPVQYRPDFFYSTAPTGFTVVSIGNKAMTPLIHTLTLQDLGPVLRGRPVVLLLSPLLPEIGGRRQLWFAGNFSRLHTSKALTGGSIPPSLRHETARQLIQYPRALELDPVLKLMAHVEAENSRWSAVLSALIRPIAWFDRAWLTWVDHLEGAIHVEERQPGRGIMQGIAPPIDWNALEQTARAEYARVSHSNPYGFFDDAWFAGDARLKTREPVSDAQFLRALDAWPAWSELKAFVHSARVVGARVLVISIPYSGAFLDARGISKRARTAYYDRLQSEARRLGVSFVDNREHDDDRRFLRDGDAHPSPVGWLVINHSIDDFVHGRRFVRQVAR